MPHPDPRLPSSPRYTQILAVVKPFRAEAVLSALGRFALENITVREAKGYGQQRDQRPPGPAGDLARVYLPKIEISVVVESGMVEALLEEITRVARTGRIGDGKIFVLGPWAVFDC